MNYPSKHHFNPAFSLKPWAGRDGRVCQMKRINGLIVPGRYHPNATGYERNLYRTDGLSPQEEQHLEENFFKPIDTAAERTLQRMLMFDKTPWTSDERSAWTRYLISLRFRNPDTVKDLKAHMLNVWVTARDTIEKNFSSWRTRDDPETFDEFEKFLDPAAPHIGATNMLIQIIDNDRIGPAVFAMHWSIHRLTNSRISLMTSDRPLDWPAGLSHPKAYIALAISPETVFLASNDPAMRDWTMSQSHTQLAKSLNKAVVVQAREYVWAADDRQIEFVRKHFGRAPAGSAITEAQKAASLRAAAVRHASSSSP